MYWEAHRGIWDTKIRPSIEALVAELEPEFGPIRTFRPNRDIRFSKDKSPYKTWAGITTSDRAQGGIGCFFKISAEGMRMAAGAMVLASDQLDQFRRAIVDDRAGAAFEKIKADLAKQSLIVGPGHDPILKQTPAGFPKDHPREAYLHWKGAIVIKEYEQAAWMQRPEAIDKILEVWRGAAPLKSWIDEHAGNSQRSKK